MDILCDNGKIHVVNQVLLPYEGTQPPQITFIGKGDITGEKTLQTGYYGNEAGTGAGRNVPDSGWNKENAPKYKINLGDDSWREAANWEKKGDRF